MTKYLVVLILFMSTSVCAKTVQVRGFDLEIGEKWEFEETAVGLKVYVPNSKDEVEFSPFLMPEGTTSEEVVKESEKELHYKLGIFLVTDTAPKFNRVTGRYSKSWLAYSKNIVMLVEYSSYNEINEEHVSNVKSILATISWTKP